MPQEEPEQIKEQILDTVDPQGINANTGRTNEVDLIWKEPGFHRPLAGIMFNLIYIILAAGLGVLFAVWLIPNLVYPFPEAMGFENVSMQLFAVYFTLLDLGIGSAIQRYVSAENVTNPRKAIQYIQFFIWYQMFSGLLQVTVIAIYVLYVIPATELAYASWFLIVYSMIQYPGNLGIFRGTLEAYQRFDKANIIGFIQYQLFENVFRIIFILLGRWIGRNNPGIGELVGATMGSIIGRYAKDFASAGLAAYWIHPIMKEIDPTWGIGVLFHVDFDREILKKCLLFGLKVLIPGLIGPAANFIAIAMMLSWMPNYSTILGLYLLGEMLAQMVTTFGFPGIASCISEAYINGRHNLTRNYIEQIMRWTMVMGFFMAGLLFSGSTFIGIIAGDNFLAVAPIIQTFVFFKLINMLAGIMDQLFIGSGKPGYNLWLNVAEQGIRLFVLWLLLVPFPSSWYAIIYSMGFGWVAKWLVGMLLFHKNVMPIKLNIYQTFIAPLGAAAVEGIAVWALVEYALPPLGKLIGLVPAALILLVLCVMLGPFFIYFPILALLGGWDDPSLVVLDKAVLMSGPSKRIVSYIRNVSGKLMKYAPLHNRFPIDFTGVEEDVQHLKTLYNQH